MYYFSSRTPMGLKNERKERLYDGREYYIAHALDLPSGLGTEVQIIWMKFDSSARLIQPSKSR